MKVKISDLVLITKGKDNGKTGKVLRVYSKMNKIVVEKVNIKVKHIKKSRGQKGERITLEAPINSANVKVICPNCNKVTRIGYKLVEGQKKLRICKKCKETVDTAVKKKGGNKAKKKS